MCLMPEPGDRQTDRQTDKCQRVLITGETDPEGSHPSWAVRKMWISSSSFISVRFHFDVLDVAQNILFSGSPIQKPFKTINLKVKCTDARQGWTLGYMRVHLAESIPTRRNVIPVTRSTGRMQAAGLFALTPPCTCPQGTSFVSRLGDDLVARVWSA